ncbi:MAG: SRPBCC family protein [Chloroflexi bacterium]|nr:SRPBCC family protein [Chloroflexota bacterium]
MATQYEKSSLIAVPAGRIFAFLSNPTNFAAIWPTPLEMTPVDSRRGVGQRTRFVFAVSGERVEWTGEVTEFVENQRVAGVSDAGGAWSWSLTPEAGGTRITWRGDFPLPAALAGKLDPAAWESQVHLLLDTLLSNLKATMEGAPA